MVAIESDVYNLSMAWHPNHLDIIQVNWISGVIHAKWEQTTPHNHEMCVKILIVPQYVNGYAHNNFLFFTV